MHHASRQSNLGSAYPPNFIARIGGLPAPFLGADQGGGRSNVEIKCTVGAVAGLPPFRGDRELRASILDAWFSEDALRLALLRAPLDVQVHEGTALLEGCGPHRLLVLRLVAQARSVPGGLEVCCAIATDEGFIRDLQSALAADARTQALRPTVRSMQGVVVVKIDLVGNLTPAFGHPFAQRAPDAEMGCTQ